MRFKFKIILLFPVILLILVGFFVANKINAGSGDNVYGWAWSENIGWISFNNTTGGGAIDYGVNIDPSTGEFSGYAWSEIVEWISFGDFDGDGDVDADDEAIVGSPCSPNCSANIDLSTGVVSGWARVLSYGGVWDGWIGLSGSWANDVTVNSSLSPSEFEGWAWGSDVVVGWVSFNCSNEDTCDAVDYKVLTSVVLNSAPSAVITCNPSCTVYETNVLVLENDSTDPESNIIQSEWSSKTQGASDATYVIRDTCIASPLCDFTPQNFIGVGNYTARLIVEDAGTLSDTATVNFSILEDALAGFRCSLDNSAWEDCDTITPTAGDLVYFIDDQSVDSNEYSQASQGGAPIISRAWQRSGDGSPFSDVNSQNPSVIAIGLSMSITLDIGDSAGRTASRVHIIGAEMPLPVWKETVPF